jgi:two-component system, NtrC family, response regulator AtoC
MTNAALVVAAQEDSGFVPGMSLAMQTLEGVIPEIAETHIPVLLVGESGTGKEVFARRLHRLSPQGGAPMKKIACAAVNLTTLTVEIGVASGTSVVGSSAAGSLFFDEISELDLGCQRQLLYALPDGERSEHAQVPPSRIISATSRNLEEEIRAGRFRAELYYRINGICLRLPPLRERKEDIPLLLEYFLTKQAALLARPRPTLSPRALRTAMEYAWPGNVRELENFARRIVALGKEPIAISEMEASQTGDPRSEPAEPRGRSLKAAVRVAAREAEKELILKALERTRWNRKRAAQELQISYKSLLYKLKQIGFEESKAN